MKPFDLKKALAGEPVVTRDGRPVTQLTLFKDVINTQKVLRGVVCNSIDAWEIDGRWEVTNACSGYAKDLFMAAVKPTMRIAIWRDEITDEIFRYRVAEHHGHKIGDRSMNGNQTLVAIKTIEWEE